MCFFVFSSSLSNLFETSSLSFETSDKGDILSANLERTKNFDFGDPWEINREDFLDSDTVNHFSDRDGLVESGFSVSLDDQPLEFLDTLLVSFSDNLVYLHFHSGGDDWPYIFNKGFLDGFDECCVHNDANK